MKGFATVLLFVLGCLLTCNAVDGQSVWSILYPVDSESIFTTSGFDSNGTAAVVSESGASIRISNNGGTITNRVFTVSNFEWVKALDPQTDSGGEWPAGAASAKIFLSGVQQGQTVNFTFTEMM